MYLAGDIDQKNPSSFKQSDIEKWSQNRDVNFLGHVKNIEKFWREMDIGIFPSLYGEGIPKSMLEAVSFSCPLVTRCPRGRV